MPIHTTNIDLERLAKSGPSAMTPCAGCGKQTKSHVIYNTGSGWGELDRRNPLADVDPGTPVKLTVVCHSCFEGIADGWWPRKGAEVTEGVVG